LDFHRNTAPNWDYSKTETYSTYVYVNETDRLLRTLDVSQPQFLYFAWQSTHLSPSGGQAPKKFLQQYSHIKNPKRRMQAAMSAALDEGVGNVIALLKKYGMWNNTILAFSADNGGEISAMGLNWPLRGGKHTLFEGGVRLLGFVNSPLIQGGHRSATLMHGVDWYPTFVRLASGSFDKSQYPFLDGYDQWDSIVDFVNNPSPRKEILHNIDPLAKSGQYDQAGIRVGDWKLLTGNPCGWTSKSHGEMCGWVPSPDKGQPIPSPPISNTVMLFNITDDPHEKNDVSGAHPLIVKQLLARIAVYRQTMVPPYQSQVNMNDPGADPRKSGGVYTPWADKGPVPPPNLE